MALLNFIFFFIIINLIYLNLASNKPLLDSGTKLQLHEVDEEEVAKIALEVRLLTSEAEIVRGLDEEGRDCIKKEGEFRYLCSCDWRCFSCCCM